MEQASLSPSSTPVCRKQNIGIETAVVEKETIIPRNPKISTGSGKMGAVGQVVNNSSSLSTRCKGRKFSQVTGVEDPYTHAYVLETQPASGNRKRDVERVLRDLSGVCGYTPHRTHVFSAHSFTHSGTNSLSPQQISVHILFISVNSDRKVVGHSC